MKTKHILTALALPVMFAACTADDIVSENNGLQKDARAKLSKDFVLNVNNGVDSRYAVIGTTGLEYKFEEGDQIGANLIDAYSPTLKDEPGKWEILPYVAPSLPFKYDGNESWKSDAELGVGNYLFTYPFNAKDNGRAAAQFELPRVQQYNSKDANAIIASNNKAVGAVLLLEGETKAGAALKNLYTYPKIRINFDNGEEVTKVTKVILQKGGSTLDNGFIYKGGIHHAAVVAMFNNEADWVEKYLEDNDVTKDVAKAKYWAQFETSDFIIDGQLQSVGTDILGANIFTEGKDGKAVLDNYEISGYGMTEKTNYLIIEMDEAVKSNSTTNNKSVEVRLMMPSFSDFSASNNDLTMHVVTDYGTYSLPFKYTSGTDCPFKFNTDDETKIKAALTRNASNTLTTKNLKISEYPGTANLGNIVTTAEDWNALVENKKNATQDVVVSILNDKFALTKDLKMPENKKGFTINTEISVEGEVTVKNVHAGVVNVAKGATLTTGDKFTATQVKVKETGNLVFAPALNDDKEVIIYGASTTEIAAKKGVQGIAEVINEGKVTIKAGAIAQFNLTNKKGAELNVEAAASRAVEGAGIANLIGENVNDGTIVNNGVINTVKLASEPNSFTNNAPSTTAGYKYDAEEGEWDGVPTIVNNGTFNAKNAVVNNGKFEQNGILSSDFPTPASFSNATSVATSKAILEIGAGTNVSTFIDYNASWNGSAVVEGSKGVIIVKAVLPTNFTIYSAKEANEYESATRGIIQYTHNTKSALSLAGSPVNYLIADGGIELTETYTYTDPTDEDADPVFYSLPTLKVINGGTVRVEATTGTGDSTVKKTDVSNLEIEGNATISGDMNTVSAIAIAKESSLTVPSNTKLTVSTPSSVTGEGVLTVQGVLHFSGATATSDGKYVITLPSNIEVNKVGAVTCPKSDAARVYTALENAVKLWWKEVKGANEDGEHYGTVYFGLNPYDVKYLAKTIADWGIAHSGGERATVYPALMTAWGLAADKQTQENFEKKLIADYTNFVGDVDEFVIGTATDDQKTEMKERFINVGAEVEDLNDTYKNLLAQNDKLYNSEAELMHILMAYMLETDGVDTYAEFEENKIAYLIISDFATALKKTTYSGKNGACAFIWKEDTCPLYKVMGTAKAYSPADWAIAWKQDPKTLFGHKNATWGQENAVNNWVKYASLVGETTEKTLAATYYPASEKWDYTVGQIAACMGVEPSTITAATGE